MMIVEMGVYMERKRRYRESDGGVGRRLEFEVIGDSVLFPPSFPSHK